MINSFLISLLGLFFLSMAIFNVDWFMNLTKPKKRKPMLGENFQRVVLAIAGLALLLFGLGSL